MALVLKDRVRETSTTTGTGTFTLAGAVAGFQSFSAIGTGNSTYYTIVSTSDWEVGIGTWTSPDQLSRDTVLASTNAGALVTFGSGTKDVFLTFPAEGFAVPPAIGSTTPNTITGTTVTVWDAAVTGTPGSFVIYDPITTGVTATFTIDPASYNPTISATDGTTNYPLQLNDGVTFPIGVNLDIGRTNSLILSNSGGAYTGLKAAAAGLSNYTLTLPTTAGSNNQVLKTDGSGNLSWTDKFVLGAGTATAGTAPLKFTSGTNLTTAEAGAMEYNGTSVFITGTTASGRGINLAPQMVRINNNRTKATNNTTLEPLFDAANDVLALAANTLYYFKGVYRIDTTASATAGGATIGFTFSNAQQDIGYRFLSHAVGYSAGQTSGYATAATATTVTATSTSAASYAIEIEGWFKSNATTGGTITPAFAQSVVGSAAAPTAAANTWLMVQPMGSPTATLLAGNWT